MNGASSAIKTTIPPVTEYTRKSLRLANDRSPGDVIESGAYHNKIGIVDAPDTYRALFDIAVYHISRSTPAPEIISILAAKNKILKSKEGYSLLELQAIKSAAYEYIQWIKQINSGNDGSFTSEEIRQKAHDIINQQEVMSHFIETFKNLHAGDEESAEVMMLISVTGSSLTSEGIHFFLTGPKGSGKSSAIRAFLHLWPQEYVISGEFSPRALYYQDIKAGSAVWPDDWYATPETESHIRRAMSNFQQGTEYQTVGKGESGKNEGITIKIPPRVSFFYSNTGDVGSDELADRQYRLSIVPDDASDQAFWEFLMKRIRTGAGPNPETEPVQICREIIRIYKAQRFKVIIPFAERILFKSLKIRRDIEMFISFMDACTVLNYAGRNQEKAVDDEGEYTILTASIKDFHQACKIYQSSENDGGREMKLSKAEMELAIWLSNQMGIDPDGILEQDIHKKYGEPRGIARTTVRRMLLGNDGNGGIINKIPGACILKVNDMESEQVDDGDGRYRIVKRRGKSQNMITVPFGLTSQSKINEFSFVCLLEGD